MLLTTPVSLAHPTNQVLRWDVRCGVRPRAVLAAPRSCGQLFSLQLSFDDQVINNASALAID